MNQTNSIHNGLIKQEWDDAYMDNSFFILPHSFASTCYNNLFERVTAMPQWKVFLFFLLFCAESKRRLNVGPVEPTVDNKIYFMFANLTFAISLSLYWNNANINGIATKYKFIEKHVLHQMGLFLLPPVQPCITKPYIFRI